MSNRSHSLVEVEIEAKGSAATNCGEGEVVWLAPWAIKLGTSAGLLSIVTLPPVLPRTSETLTGREELARLLTNSSQSTRIT